MDKILKIQTEIGALVKDKTNPYFKSKYTDINQVIEQLLPLLEKYELTVVQPLSTEGALGGGTPKPALKTIVYDGDKQIICETIPLPENTDPQKMGSAITYYRRYALQSLFLLRAEDDDANTAKPDNVSKDVGDLDL